MVGQSKQRRNTGNARPIEASVSTQPMLLSQPRGVSSSPTVYASQLTQSRLFDKFVSLLIAKCIRKLENEKRKPKPDDYRLSESLPADEGQIPLSACDCPIPKTGETGCGDQCLNRIMHYECDDNNCRLSVQQCSNRVLADDVVGPEQYLAHRENSSLTFPPTAKTSRSVTATSPSFQAPVATMIGKHGDDEKMVPVG